MAIRYYIFVELPESDLVEIWVLIVESAGVGLSVGAKTRAAVDYAYL